MTGPRAPAGWYPDPSDANVVRYWDGDAWTDLAAAPSPPLPEDRLSSAESPPDQPAPVVRESTTPAWARVGMTVLAALVIVGLVVFAIESATDPDPPFGAQPRDEREVVDLIENARREYDAANHDLQRDAALAERDERICALLGDGRVEDWTGKIYEIDSNGDGKGIIGINIEPNTQVTTRGSAFSADNTLIPPGAAPRPGHRARRRPGRHVQRALRPRRRRPVLHQSALDPGAEHRQATHGVPVQRRAPVVPPVQLAWKNQRFLPVSPSSSTSMMSSPSSGTASSFTISPMIGSSCESGSAAGSYSASARARPRRGGRSRQRA